MGNYASADSILTFHFATLTPSWTVLINIGIYAAFFKHTILGFYVHLIISLFVTLITIITPIFYLLPDGIQTPCSISETNPNCDPIKFPHAVIGTFVFFWISVQAATGFFLRAWQQYPNASAIGVKRSQKIHTYSGFIVLFFGKAIQFIKWRNVPAIWITIGVWQLFSIIVYIRTKYYFSSFQSTVIDKRIFSQNLDIQKIRYIQELKKGKYGYVVFADYVFDIAPLLTLHPGGYQIIQATQGRQVDRFIYGMYSAEGISQITKYSHTEKSFHLLGNPIAKIDNPNPYKNMKQLNDCEIQKIQVISQNSQIYLFSLSLKDKKKKFSYKGYSKINQIGQYFSLSAENQITRLYTTVNCLSKTNIQLISQIANQNPQQNKKFNIINSFRVIKLMDSKKEIVLTQSTKQLNIQFKSSSIFLQEKQNNNVVPLLIKVYENGKLTPKLLNDKFKNLQISCTRGQGLKLDLLKPGRIIFVAGGTGFYPFMDLVDLMYKRKLINENKIDTKIKETIIRSDPLLKQDLLNGFQVVFFIALSNHQDLHPMSFYQLNYLASFDNFKCTFRVNRKSEEQLKKTFQNFKYSSQYFNVIAFPQIIRTDTEKTYLCGPPIMLDNFAKLFKQNKVDERKYQFV